MHDAMTYSEIASLIANVVGVIGGMLGGFTYLKARAKEKEDEAMWKLFFYISGAAQGNRSYDPPIGSDLHKLCEIMVQKGMLARSSVSGYCLPNPPIP